MKRKLLLPLLIIHFLASVLFAQNEIIAVSAGSSPKIDSLLFLLKKDISDTNKVIHLNILCKEYLSNGSYDIAFSYGSAALQLAEYLNFKKGIAIAYNGMGDIYYRQGNYPQALENQLTSHKISEEIGDKRTLAASYNGIGNIYCGQGNYAKALENHFASLKIKEEIGDKRGLASSYNGIGNCYNGQGNYARAIENHIASLKIKEELGDKKGMATSYNNIGVAYKDQGDFDKALSNDFASLSISEQIRDKMGIAHAYINIGETYLAKNNYSEAISYLQNSLQLFKESGVKEGVLEAYLNLSKANEKMGNYKNAHTHHILYSQYKDSVFNEISSKQLAEMQAKYEIERKDKENKSLVQENLLKQAEIEKRTLLLIILLGVLVFTVSISLLLYNRYKLKQRSLMAQELNYQQRLLSKAVIDAEEKERRRISHELHDGLGQLLSTAKLNISVLEEVLPPNEKHLQNALSLLDNAIDEVRTISHNMMPSVLIRLGLISALRELARKISDSNKVEVKVTANYDQRLNDINEIAIYRIIQESTNNILKYSEASCISIILNKSSADLFVEMKDNGRGFDTSEIEKSNGIGWKNIYARVSLLNGVVRIISEASKGTTINIHFLNLFASPEPILS